MAIAFFLMVTAVTYQFRGWLASMMTNPRRRRTIVALLTMTPLFLILLPHMLAKMDSGSKARKMETADKIEILEEEFDEGRITEEEYQKRREVLDSEIEVEADKEEANIRLINMVISPGWLMAPLPQPRGVSCLL